jgi:predicted RNA-binding protein YlqC (UPF0109 family)
LKKNFGEVKIPKITFMEEKVSEILENILGLLGLEGSFEVEEKEEGVFVSIDAEDPGILIGRNGETLSSLQLIINLVVSRQMKDENPKRVVVDVSSWRKSKEEELDSKAQPWGDIGQYSSIQGTEHNGQQGRQARFTKKVFVPILRLESLFISKNLSKPLYESKIHLLEQCRPLVPKPGHQRGLLPKYGNPSQSPTPSWPTQK